MARRLLASEGLPVVGEVAEMAKRNEHETLIAYLLNERGRTFAEELRIPMQRGSPQALFQLLVASLLFSARIRFESALKAARALFDHGLTSVEKMLAASWEERVRVLNRSGYARYDESTSRMLGETSQLLLEKYGGDLRRLRAQARRDPKEERRLLKECKGIGDVGVDIFFREVQGAWEELFPFIDARAKEGADQLGLPTSADPLRALVSDEDLPRLVVALVRTRLRGDADEMRARALGKGGMQAGPST